MDITDFYTFMLVVGAFEIIAGIALAFYGFKIFTYVVFFTAFSSIFVGIMAFGFTIFNFFGDDKTSLISTLLTAIVTGGLVTYL